MYEKTADVFDNLERHLAELSLPWGISSQSTSISTAALYGLTLAITLPRIGHAAQHGLHWFYSRLPAEEPEIKLDVRGT